MIHTITKWIVLWGIGALLLLSPHISAQSKRQVDSLVYLISQTNGDTAAAREFNDYIGQFDHNLALADTFGREVLRMAQQRAWHTLKSRAYRVRGYIFQRHGRADSSFYCYQQASKAAHEAGDTVLWLNAQRLRSTAKRKFGAYQEAQVIILESLPVARAHPRFKRFYADFLLEAGSVQKAFGNLEASANYYRQAMALTEKSKVLSGAAHNLGNVYLRMRKLDSAIIYFEQSLSLRKVPQGKIVTYNSLGIAHTLLKKWTQAEGYFKQGLALSDSTGLPFHNGTLLFGLGQIKRAQKQYAEADSLYQIAYTLAESDQDLQTKTVIIGEMALLDSLSGNLASAMKLRWRYFTLRDSLFGAEKQAEVDRLNQRIEIGEKEHQIQLLEKENEYERQRKQTLWWAFVVLLVLSAGLVVSLIRSVRSKKRQLHTEKELRTTQETLYQNSLQQQEREALFMEERMAFNSQRLQNLATTLLTKKEMLQELEQLIKNGLGEELTGNAQTLLMKKIKPHLLFDKEQQDLELFLDQANQSFLFQLEQRYPDLTKQEKKLCSFIRMGLPSRQIATFMGISSKSLEMARYRLRKKLGMATGDDLNALLGSKTFLDAPSAVNVQS
ncbi:MAG: tetratricopeptide repeat protein [Salibacteraceae bacterium]